MHARGPVYFAGAFAATCLRTSLGDVFCLGRACFLAMCVESPFIRDLLAAESAQGLARRDVDAAHWIQA